MMSDTEELHVGDFNPSTYEHVLPEGAHDFDDYDSEYEEKHPELGFTDEQVEAEVEKLNPEDKKFYEEYRGFLDAYYRQHGKIIEMPDLIKLIMTGRYPEIPSTTRKEQEELREKLMIETRKREMSQQAGLEEEPPRKIRRIVPERIGKIIDVTGDDDPDAPMIIKIMPGVDPYAQLDLEEEELEYKVGDETASEVHPDDADADDLSCITIDSLKHIDNEKVKEIWAGMAKLKHQEGEYYEQLAGMVDECKSMPLVRRGLTPLILRVVRRSNKLMLLFVSAAPVKRKGVRGEVHFPETPLLCALFYLKDPAPCCYWLAVT